MGCGYLGRHHARILTELADSEPVGFVEPDDATADAIEAAHGAKGLVRRRSVKELLGAGATAVVVSSPTSTHADVAEELLAGGADVMVEKPVTATLAEADRLVALARAKGRVLQVGHIERFNPAVAAVRPLVTDVKFIEAHRLGVFVPRALDVDVVLDLLVHDLDIALDLVGKPVTEIRAVGVPILSEKIDIASVRLSFEGGCVANLTASRVSQEKTRKFRFFQPDWYFSIDTQNRDVTAFRLDRVGGPLAHRAVARDGRARRPPHRRGRRVPEGLRGPQRAGSDRRGRPRGAEARARHPRRDGAGTMKKRRSARRRGEEKERIHSHDAAAADAAADSRKSSPRKADVKGALRAPRSGRRPLTSAFGSTRIGLIGGSGLYTLPGLQILEERRLRTPFGDSVRLLTF